MVGIERDGEALLEATGQVDLGDAIDARDLGHDLGAGDLGDGVEAARRSVEAMDEMTTGVALMLRAEIVGSTASGRPALAIPSSMAAVASLTFVP